MSQGIHSHYEKHVTRIINREPLKRDLLQFICEDDGEIFREVEINPREKIKDMSKIVEVTTNEREADAFRYAQEEYKHGFEAGMEYQKTLEWGEKTYGKKFIEFIEECNSSEEHTKKNCKLKCGGGGGGGGNPYLCASCGSYHTRGTFCPKIEQSI